MMKHTKIILVFALCAIFIRQQADDTIQSCLYKPKQIAAIKLIDSIDTIVELIQSNNLESLFEDPEQDVIKNIIRNYSPAYIALEAEVLSQDEPVILFFTTTDAEYNDKIESQLLSIIENNRLPVTIIEVDSELLFSVARMLSVHVAPTVIILHSRIELGRKEEVELDDELSEWANDILEDVYLIKGKKKSPTDW